VILGGLAVEPSPLIISRDELREVALAQRPDVMAAQRAVDAAQRTLNQTRVAANQAHFDYRLSLYQLEQAVGQPLGSPEPRR
jgi:outer membrane protein TolC